MYNVYSSTAYFNGHKNRTMVLVELSQPNCFKSISNKVTHTSFILIKKGQFYTTNQEGSILGNKK